MKKNIPLILVLFSILYAGSTLLAQSLETSEFSQLSHRIDRIEIQMDKNLWTVLLSAGGFVLVLLGGFVAIRKAILTQVRKDIDTKAVKVVETEVPKLVHQFGKKAIRDEFDAIKAVVNKMADEVGFERIARSNFNMLVIAQNEGDARFVRELLERMGFDPNKIKTQKMANYPEVKTDGYDLVIFEDLSMKAQLDMGEVQKYVSRRSKGTFLYHGASRELKFEPRNIHLNFANSWFTLYPRIMETLRYLHFNPEENPIAE